MVRRFLFICVGNSFRSQMAEGFARQLAPKGVLIKSGGLKPAKALSAMAVELMAERGIDISRQEPKEVDVAFARRADRIVVMGCDPEEACPAEVLDRVENWSLPNPRGMEYDAAREVRDGVERRVRELVESL
ncbi:MAG: low molecular weight phosphatase family protein [Thermoplasmata archaeon]